MSVFPNYLRAVRCIRFNEESLYISAANAAHVLLQVSALTSSEVILVTHVLQYQASKKKHAMDPFRLLTFYKYKNCSR
jgi:hypothetical protein